MRGKPQSERKGRHGPSRASTVEITYKKSGIAYLGYSAFLFLLKKLSAISRAIFTFQLSIIN